MDLDLFDVFEGNKTNLNTNLNINVNTNSTIIKTRLNKRTRQEIEIENDNKKNENENERNERIEDTLFTEHTENSLSVTGSDRKITTILALPADYVPTETTTIPRSTEPAKVYPFKLDTFQQEAINCIEKNESVLVAAHTSAGKTVCAEYAIAKSLKNKQRVIYTSPIKALSNQKFRDIQAEFGDVGLMTGDMTINPGATCLIMTTEILRNMLYRGSEVMREVAWVIYDEVHYMRDKERGVVWEESIILLPHKVRFVFLSATIPNAKEFVGWVAKTHHQPCHVVYTDYRPVPLEHYIFPASSEGLFLVVDGKGKFREDNFQRGMAALHPTNELETEKNKKRKKGGQGVESDLFKVVRLIMERELDPCIVFSFSKKDCETYALQMSRLDFNNDDEKNLIEQVFLNAIEALSDDDRRLPQVETLLPLLKKGIGIHHGGLLPILKEIIEILFQEGLIKCLFATETFSIGINMPAKTVVFTQTRKFDGEDFRWITSGEYIQMSGRAGRRGKDDRGIVIQMIDEKMEPDVAKGILYGESDPLYSSYHVSYNMVLNMMRVEDADPEHILRASFYQYQREQKIPEIEQIITELKQVSTNIQIPNETILSDYHLMCKQVEKIQYDINKIIYQTKYCLPFLQPGRVVMLQIQSGIGSQISKEDQLDLPFLKDEEKIQPTELIVNWGYGIIVNCRKNDLVQKNTGTLSDNVELIIGKCEDIRIEYIIDVLVEIIKLPDGVLNPFQLNGIPSNYIPYTLYDTLSDEIKTTLRQSPTSSTTTLSTTTTTTTDNSNNTTTSLQKELIILQFNINTLSNISAVRLTLPTNLRKKGVISNIYKSFQELKRRFTGTPIPLLDPKSDMSIEESQYDILLNRYNELTTRLQELSQRNSNIINENNLKLYKKKEIITNHIKNLHLIINNKKNIQLKSILKNIKLILKKHHFITVNDVLETKGRFACELNIANELLLTDLIFDGIFNTISVEQSVSLLSCFVYNEITSSSTVVNKLRSDFQSLYTQLLTYAKKHYQLRIDLNKKYTETSENEFNNTTTANNNNAEGNDEVNTLNPELMEATYLWCCGSKFIDICRVTDVFEGNIIRVIKRLEELLRQLSTASSIIGNIELKDKFEEGANKIRRGIIFTSSLYL